MQNGKTLPDLVLPRVGNHHAVSIDEHHFGMLDVNDAAIAHVKFERLKGLPPLKVQNLLRWNHTVQFTSN